MTTEEMTSEMKRRMFEQDIRDEPYVSALYRQASREYNRGWMTTLEKDLKEFRFAVRYTRSCTDRILKKFEARFAKDVQANGHRIESRTGTDEIYITIQL
jgi:hypothetical protein